MTGKTTTYDFKLAQAHTTHPVARVSHKMFTFCKKLFLLLPVNRQDTINYYYTRVLGYCITNGYDFATENERTILFICFNAFLRSAAKSVYLCKFRDIFNWEDRITLYDFYVYVTNELDKFTIANPYHIVHEDYSHLYYMNCPTQFILSDYYMHSKATITTLKKDHSNSLTKLTPHDVYLYVYAMHHKVYQLACSWGRKSYYHPIFDVVTGCSLTIEFSLIDFEDLNFTVTRHQEY